MASKGRQIDRCPWKAKAGEERGQRQWVSDDPKSSIYKG